MPTSIRSVIAGLGHRPGWRICALILVGVGAVGASTANALWPFDRFQTPAPLAERAASLLSQAIQIPTVNPPGGEARLARLFAAELDRAGLENRVIATPTPEGEPQRAAVWGRLRSRTGAEQPGEALILLSHLDTVPAEPSEWSVDPFSGSVQEGFVWGRGALDAKGVAVTQLLALIELASRDVALNRDVILLATPEEETGGLRGAGWIVREHPELFEDGGFLLTEGGGIQVETHSDTRRPPVWGVTLTEKAPCWLELRARGRGGHSSAPASDAAVPKLIAALDRIRRAESSVRVLDPVQRMFATLAPYVPEWDREGFADLAQALEHDESFRRRFLDNAGQNALVRNTVSITVLEGASKTNVAPSVARAQLDARLLPGEHCEDFRASIESLVDEPAIEIDILLSFPARASSPDTSLYRAIESIAAEQDPPGLVLPRMIGGFTDAHWFRELGLVAYGFVPRALSAAEARRVHGVDERVSIATLVESIEMMIGLIERFDRIDSAERGR